MHSTTYYAVLLMGIKKADLPKFQLLFYNRLMEQLIYDGIKVVDPMQTLLLKDAAPHFLPSDNNRKALGTINRFIQEIEIMIDYTYGGKMEAHLLTDLNHFLTQSLTGALKPKKYDYGLPLGEMKKLVEGDGGWVGILRFCQAYTDPS